MCLMLCHLLQPLFLIRKLEVKKNSVQENSELQGKEMKVRDWLSSGILLAVLIQWTGAGMDGIFNVLISVYAVDLFLSGELGVGLLYGALGTGLMTSFFLMKLCEASSAALFHTCACRGRDAAGDCEPGGNLISAYTLFFCDSSDRRNVGGFPGYTRYEKDSFRPAG